MREDTNFANAGWINRKQNHDLFNPRSGANIPFTLFPVTLSSFALAELWLG